MTVIEKTFSVSDLSIQVSADSIARRVSSLQGVRKADVSIASHTMRVEFDEDLITPNRIIQAVREAGYQAYLKESPQPRKETEEIMPVFSRSLILPAVLAAVSLILAYMPAGCLPALLAALLSFGSLKNILPDVRQEIRSGRYAGETMLVLLAVLAFVSGIFLMAQKDPDASLFFADTACTMLAAQLIRRWMHRRRQILMKSRSSISASLPATASVYENHHEKLEAISELKIDQIIVIRPGETVPADGRVVKGFAVMDESGLTGWDKPVEKSKGSYVYANSRCLKGSIDLKTEKVGNTTAMMKLAELAEKTASDSSFRSPFRNFTKNLFFYVVLAAFLSGIGLYYSAGDTASALSGSLAVLACSALPALAMISANAVMNTARRAASEHILFRSVDALEMVGRTDQLVMEQDNTVTDNELTVTDFIPSEEMSAGELEYIAYALESRSDMPFARAITRYLRTRKISGIDRQEFSRLSSKGRQAIKTMSRYRAGFLEDIIGRGIDTSAWDSEISRLRQEGKRVLLFTEDSRIIGLIAAIRPLIPGAADALRDLQEMNIAVTLLTDGTADESALLQEKLNPENVMHQPARYETERLLQNLSDSNAVTAFLSGNPDHISSMPADVTAVIGTGANTSYEHAGLQLTRKRLGDFLNAVTLSRDLNSRIQYAQIAVIIYHALAVSLFGFLLPAFLPVRIPLILPLACSLAATFAASRFR